MVSIVRTNTTEKTKLVNLLICVCVCARERKRERDRGLNIMIMREKFLFSQSEDTQFTEVLYLYLSYFNEEKCGH